VELVEPMRAQNVFVELVEPMRTKDVRGARGANEEQNEGVGCSWSSWSQ